ncbi:MAG: hypothetical protein ACPG7F_19135 [Aggregatilineales bacterium]
MTDKKHAVTRNYQQKIIVLLIAMCLISACQSIAGENVPATLQYDMTTMANESLSIQNGAVANLTEVAATVAVIETQAAAYAQVNNVMRSTLQAVQTPTPALRSVVADSGSVMSADMIDTSDGVMRFVQVGIADFVNPADNCFERHINIYRDNTSRIYLVALGVNVQAGTRLDVSWRAGQEIVQRNGWTAPADATVQCIAIELNTAQSAPVPGNWEAMLFVNGQDYEPAVFTILQ